MYTAVFIYDVILLTPTRVSMQSLSNIASEYADCFGLRLKLNKCKLQFSDVTPINMRPRLLNGI